MSLESPVSANPSARHTSDVSPNDVSQSTPPGKHESNDLQHLTVRPSLSRHYSSLQEHADRRQFDKAVEDDGGLTPRQDIRRDGFTWGLQPTNEDQDEQRQHSRNPLPPEHIGKETPPTLDEIMRRPTNDDADTAHNARVSRANTSGAHPFIEQLQSSWTTSESPTRHDARKPSIAWFGRSLVKYVPDTRLTPPSGAAMDSLAEREVRFSSGSVSSTGHIQEAMRERKLSFVLPTSTRQGTSLPTSTRQGTSMERITRQTSEAGQSVVSNNDQKGSLRERRKVKLDLKLPAEVSALPPRSRSPVTSLSGITKSRPRSPKTPWTRHDPPGWSQSTARKTSPAAEENYISRATCGENSDALGLLPGNDAIMSSSSPHSEHVSTPKVRDRHHNSRPRLKRSRSGHYVPNEDALPITPDGNWTPDESRQPKIRQPRIDPELEQLGKAARSARAGRWRWARSTTRSSDGAPTSPSEETSNRRFSINPFKRSGRISDHHDKERETAQTPSPHTRLWWIGKQPATPAQSEHRNQIHISPPPVFTPPGLTRVPTPQVLDANGEVKTKLAGFFFDPAASIEGRKARASPKGHWDSDALLMSYLSPDLDLDEQTEDEGPEGPTTPEYAPRGFTVDRNPGWDTPGLVPAPGGYLDAKRLPPIPQKSAAPEVWFRIPSDQSRMESQLTELALRELEERRKFEWLVPEHLPNSPLCPLHAAYNGYSKGICYWHGRRKSSSSKSKASEEIVGGVYDTAKREKRRQRMAAKKGSRVGGDESPVVRRGVRGEGGQFDISLEEARQTKRRRLASFSSP